MQNAAKIENDDNEAGQENALVVIENKTGNSLIEAFQPNGLESLITAYRARALAFKGDISTKKGRDEIRSFARSIANDKTKLEKLGKQSVEDLQKIVKAVTAERMRAVKALEEIQDTVRKPLTDWENADKIRTQAHEADIKTIENAVNFAGDDSAHIQGIIDSLKRFHNKDWQEFANRGALAIETTTKTLTARHSAAVQREKEKVELERLRKEEADRKQREHEEKLKSEAAEKARKEAEAEAQRKADEEAKRVRVEQEKAEREKAAIEAKAKADAEKAEQERLKLEREKQAEHERAEKAEKDRIAAEEKAKRDAEEAKAKSEREAKLVAEKAEKDKLAAIQAEKDRVAAEKKREADELAKREADKAHRTKINNDALHDIIKAIQETAAITADYSAISKVIVAAIAKGDVRHVKINY